MFRAAQRWVEGVETARLAGSRLGADYLEVRYEDLVTDTREQLERICLLLDINFEQRMLSLDKPSENLGDARGATHVVMHNFGKFSNLMSRRTLAKVEHVAGETLIASGYSLALPSRPRKNLSSSEMWLAQILDGLNLVRHAHEGRGIWKTAKFHLRYFFTTRAR